VQVLSFGWEIVSVLISVLEGTAASDRLKDLLGQFGSIGSNVKAAYDVRKQIYSYT